MADEAQGGATATEETPAAAPRKKVLPELDAELMKTTRLYELSMIFDPAEASRSWERLEAWIKELIEEKLGQHVLRIDKWADSRKLAYEMKGLRRGTYMIVWFRSESQHIDEIERVLRLDERVVRHLVLVHEEEPHNVGVTADELEAAAAAAKPADSKRDDYR